MPLIPGTRVGVYDIVSPLGAGGMGEVYRARDGKLNRDVAIKILPESFVADPERVARFEREAQLLASLNHPHIGAIYGLDHAGPTQFLVLELVEGETLADRIAGAPLRVDEALTIARQIADALQAAHDKGIIHRDLKPANIALTHDGQVKVLDFGLAKVDPTGGASASGGPTHSPTLTFAHTQAGVILGTAAYMSPEQAKGRAADKRSDIWAFGAILYEMLAGRRTFGGEDITDTITAVMRDEPDWSALPPNVPDQIRALLKQCLVKDRQARVADIAVARYVLNATSAAASGASAAAGPTPASARSSRVVLAAAIAGGLVAGLAIAGAIRIARRGEPPTATVTRFSVTVPTPYRLPVSASDRILAISADGKTVAYRIAAQTTSTLFIRRLDRLDSQTVAVEGEVREPFFSPDGVWLGFFSGPELKKVRVDGGAAMTIGRIASIGSRGATWTADDQIVFSTMDNTGLFSVQASGGTPRLLLASPPAAVFQFPNALPGGQGILFEMRKMPTVDGQVAVLDIRSGRYTTLIATGTSPQYVDGWIVYNVAGTLQAIAFDLARLAVSGAPISLSEQVRRSAVGAGYYAISRNGTLVYVPGGRPLTAPQRTLVWVDRAGRETPTNFPARAYADPRVSPDGTLVAVGSRDEQNDLWIGNFARHTLTRLTSDPTLDQAPVWTPDGKRLIWSSQRTAGIPNLFIQQADGTGQAQPLASSRNPLFSTSITPDGRRVIFWENTTNNSQDVLMIDVPPNGGAAAKPEALLHTAASELDAEVSPDGQWLAYQSNDSGRPEVYVRPFPAVDRGRWQVSSDGASRPMWARNGKELFYVDGQGSLTVVSAGVRGAAFDAGQPATLFSMRYLPGSTALGLDLRGFDIAPDGQRFLVVKEPWDSANATPSDGVFVVVVNWIAELNARRPPR